MQLYKTLHNNKEIVVCHSPIASFVMFTKLLQHVNLYHGCLSILLYATYNFYCNHFLSFLVPTFQDLAKCTCIQQISMKQFDTLPTNIHKLLIDRTHLRPFFHESYLQITSKQRKKGPNQYQA